MAYLPNTEADQQAMLREIGAASMEELLESIPAELRLQRPLDLPPAIGELELTALLERLAAANLSTQQAVCFLGAGAYDHFVPAVVDFVASRSEFYTAYTPYQPEASQGTLQAMFEYQTLITQLTALEVSNASLYDGASATAEAVLMALVGRSRAQPGAGGRKPPPGISTSAWRVSGQYRRGNPDRADAQWGSGTGVARAACIAAYGVRGRSAPQLLWMP
jgi:glycine cleavage system pyridoxal-binding protein P